MAKLIKRLFSGKKEVPHSRGPSGKTKDSKVAKMIKLAKAGKFKKKRVVHKKKVVKAKKKSKKR